MKFIQKRYCSIDLGDTLYIVNNNNIVEHLTVTQNHLQKSSIMKPNEKVIDNLYLASDYYEITDDGRLKLNILSYIYPDHSDIPDLFKETKLANVFIDKEQAIKFAENRKQHQAFYKEFTEYPEILIYNIKTNKILGNVSTTEPFKCLVELTKLMIDLEKAGFDVDIAVFDNKKYELIKDLKILNIIRKTK